LPGEEWVEESGGFLVADLGLEIERPDAGHHTDGLLGKDQWSEILHVFSRGIGRCLAHEERPAVLLLGAEGSGSEQGSAERPD
jgi:hypothetical protein